MTVDEIYDRYGVPAQLRLHMLRAAAVGRLIADNWAGPPLRMDELSRVLLLHDMGNVAKIRPDDAAAAARQAEFIRIYGSDDHGASQVIGVKLGLSPDEIELMGAKIFVRNDETIASNDFTLKVAAYADQRVAPDGVMPLMDRLEEARLRYRDQPGASMNNPRTDMLINCAATLEAQIAEHLRLAPDGITEEAIAPYMDDLVQTDL